jgi:hypothetical protein
VGAHDAGRLVDRGALPLHAAVAVMGDPAIVSTVSRSLRCYHRVGVFVGVCVCQRLAVGIMDGMLRFYTEKNIARGGPPAHSVTLAEYEAVFSVVSPEEYGYVRAGASQFVPKLRAQFVPMPSNGAAEPCVRTQARAQASLQQ